MEIVYVAIGKKFVDEAVQSASTVRKFIPEAFISIYTNENVSLSLFDKILIREPPQNSLRAIERWSRTLKAEAILSGDSSEILYLDTDTVVVADIRGIWNIPPSYELAVCHDTWRHKEIYEILHATVGIMECPHWVPFYNAGILFVRKTPKMFDFIHQWGIEFNRNEILIRDQVVFRSLIFRHDPKVFTLSAEYNVRSCEPIHISGAARILHQHFEPQENVSAFANFLNSSHSNRLYNPSRRELTIFRLSGTEIRTFR